MIIEDENDSLRTAYLPYIGKYIAVGIPHLQDRNRCFFHYGTCIYVSKTGLHLKLKNGGLLVIPFESIREVSVGVY